MDFDSIFVSIASYRDKECNATANDAFEKAKYPNRVVVGICQQNTSDDPDCITDSIYKSQIRIIRIPHIEAKGPTYARWLAASLVQDERFFFQIDSHSRFVQDWDVKLVGMFYYLQRAGFENPIISHYPPAWSEDKTINFNEELVPHICKAFFNERGMISLLGAHNLKPTDFPKPSGFIAGGMMFCETKAIREVPYDPSLHNLFVGEEILHSIRFFTWGYDIFTPNVNIVFHYYTRENEPKFWELKKSDQEAHEKVLNFLLGNASGIIDLYGMGKKRSLKEYYDFTGIDIKRKKVTKNFCTNSTNDPDTESKARRFGHSLKFTIVTMGILFLLIVLSN